MAGVAGPEPCRPWPHQAGWRLQDGGQCCAKHRGKVRGFTQYECSSPDTWSPTSLSDLLVCICTLNPYCLAAPRLQRRYVSILDFERETLQTPAYAGAFVRMITDPAKHVRPHVLLHADHPFACRQNWRCPPGGPAPRSWHARCPPVTTTQNAHLRTSATTTTTHDIGVIMCAQ